MKNGRVQAVEGDETCQRRTGGPAGSGLPGHMTANVDCSSRRHHQPLGQWPQNAESFSGWHSTRSRDGSHGKTR